MLRRTRIIWRCIFLGLIAACVFWWAWQKSFHLKTLVSNGETAYEPGFYYSTPNGMIFGKSAFRQIKDGKLVSGESYLNRYPRAYPKSALEELANAGCADPEGRLLFYRHYPFGNVYLYDRWQGQPLFCKIIVADSQGIRQFLVEKGNDSDTIINCTANENYVYLHRHTGWDEVAVVQLELETGAQKNYYATVSGFDPFRSDRSWLDPRTGQVIVLTEHGGKKELQAHSFQTGETKTISLTKPVSWVLASEDSFLLVNPWPGQISFYAYDLNWNPTPEKNIEIPLIDIADVRRIKPLTGYREDESVHLVDGIAYGCIEGEEALWYYAVDLEAQKVVTLWEIRPPKGDLRLRSHFLFHKETGCEPYPTLF